MEIKQYLHTAILVSDLAKAEHFYGTVLGLNKVDRILKFPGIWYEIGSVQIHLIFADQIPSDLVNTEKLGRNRHLAFGVGNLEIAKQQLLKHNCSFQSSGSGRSAIFTQDPDGNIIELTEL